VIAKAGVTTLRPGAEGRDRAREIRDYVLQELDVEGFKDISQTTAQRFGVSRQVVYKQLKRLQSKGLIEGRGRTKARVHRLAVTQSSRTLLVEKLNEDTLWQEFVHPSLRDLAENVLGICQYGFTEMVNNVIDHSESEKVVVTVKRTVKSVDLSVTDVGVGIFRKIQNAMTLPSLQEALFELTKGKFTTDPARHTGEGIFYTSRVFDNFRLLSNGLFLHHVREGDDWLLGSDDRGDVGTYVAMEIDAKSSHTLQEVFEHYAAERDDYGFSKTNVVMRLMDTGDDSFVSRSQAKRALARLPRFKEVLLDFDGVQSIGPAFADEIFRVFTSAHPEVHLTAIRANDEVRKMVDRALRAGLESPAPPATE
jgi:DNA-binding MarR family transcriptional regulator